MMRYLLMALAICVSLFPFAWAAVSSLRKGAELFDGTLWPHKITLSNYRAVFLEQHFGENLGNSFLVAASVVALSLFLGVLAAYAIGRVAFRGRQFLLLAFLCVSMFPQIAVLSGLYELVSAMGLYDSLAALGFSYLILTIPFTVWVLTAFVRTVPKEIEEAARIDGASMATILLRIFLPLLAPALVTTSLLTFILCWNEFLFALTLTQTDSSRTVPVAISMMSGSSQFELPWGLLMAASVVVTLPLVVLVLVFQRRIVAGLTAGALKG